LYQEGDSCIVTNTGLEMVVVEDSGVLLSSPAVMTEGAVKLGDSLSMCAMDITRAVSSESIRKLGQVVAQSQCRRIISFPLPIESPLIFQPPPIASHTSHFLAIEIWNRIVRTRTAWIDSVFLYALKEATLFYVEILQSSPVQQPPQTIPHNRPDQPTQEGRTKGCYSNANNRIGRDQFGNVVRNSRDLGKSVESTSCRGQRSAYRGSEAVATAHGSHLEEIIPIESCRTCRGGRIWREVCIC